MSKRKRRSFTKEYKAEVVELIRKSGKTISAVSRELDLTETSVRRWVERACPKTVQALLSLTPSCCCTKTTQRLRLSGLRSFPWTPPSGSGCPR